MVPKVLLEPLLRAECRASMQGMSLQSQGWREGGVMQLRDSIPKSTFDKHLQLGTHCSSFQPSASSHKVLISPRSLLPGNVAAA